MAKVFVCGADMAPAAIRARFPEGRFTGAGWIDGNTFAGSGLERIWGLIIENAEIPGDQVAVTQRDGSKVDATLASSPHDLAEEDAVLAQRRYWELPA